jgi:hypothetical protein
LEGPVCSRDSSRVGVVIHEISLGMEEEMAAQMMFTIEPAVLWIAEFHKDFAVVVTNLTEHGTITLYRGTEQQCKDWLRTMRHQKKLKERLREEYLRFKVIRTMDRYGSVR